MLVLSHEMSLRRSRSGNGGGFARGAVLSDVLGPLPDKRVGLAPSRHDSTMIGHVGVAIGHIRHDRPGASEFPPRPDGQGQAERRSPADQEDAGTDHKSHHSQRPEVKLAQGFCPLGKRRPPGKATPTDPPHLPVAGIIFRHDQHASMMPAPDNLEPVPAAIAAALADMITAVTPHHRSWPTRKSRRLIPDVVTHEPGRTVVRRRFAP